MEFAGGSSGDFLEQAQLRIWQTTDRYGHLWWNIYDPITRQSIQLPSEQEVRIWIDESYSRRQALTIPNLRSYWFSHLRG